MSLFAHNFFFLYTSFKSLFDLPRFYAISKMPYFVHFKALSLYSPEQITMGTKYAKKYR